MDTRAHRRIGPVLLVLGVLLAPLAVGSTAAAATVLSVTPTAGVSGGQQLQVDVAGLRPGVVAGWCQTPPIMGVEYCGEGTIVAGTTAPDGTIGGVASLERHLYVPGLGRWIDCAAPADPTEECGIGAAEEADIFGTGAIQALEWSAPPPPPSTRGSIELSATASGAFLVAGSGFRPDAVVDVFQCETGATHPSGCSLRDERLTADSTGAFTTSLVPDASVTPPGGTTSSCLPRSSAACSIVVAEAVDFVGTAVGQVVPPVPKVVPYQGTVVEGDSGSTFLEVPVTLSEPTSLPVTVDWSMLFRYPEVGNQADPATDITPASGSLTFAPGETDKSVSIEVHGDVLAEPEEYVLLSFSNPTNAKMGGFWGLGIGYIVDDDAPAVVLGEGSTVEGDAGTTVLEVPLTLSNPSTATVTLRWSTAFVAGLPGDQAEPGTDYLAVDGTVTFAPGETEAVVSVPVNGDQLVEPDEFVVVSFFDLANATFAGVPGTTVGTAVTIVNDD